MSVGQLTKMTKDFMDGHSTRGLKVLALRTDKRSGILKYKSIKWHYYELDGQIEISLMFN